MRRTYRTLVRLALAAAVVSPVAAPVALAQLPSDAAITAALNETHAKFKALKEGKNADYIPALAKVDPNIFGIALVTTTGKVYTAGDITSQVSCCNERGLLGLAFHPAYEDNGRFFLDYTDTNGDTVIAEYARSRDDPARASFALRRLLPSHSARSDRGRGALGAAHARGRRFRRGRPSRLCVDGHRDISGPTRRR